MDLLGGYGSDASDSDEEDRVAAVPVQPSTAGSGSVQRHSAAPSTSKAMADAASMPPPPPRYVQQTQDDLITGPSDAALWSKLPEPKSTQKKVVIFRPLLKKELLLAAAKDAELDAEEPAAKRLKPSGRKSGLMDFLPPPKNEAASALGAGASSASAKSKLPSKADTSPAAADAAGVPADFFSGQDSAQQAAGAYSNETYRVADNDPDAHVSSSYPADQSAHTWTEAETAAYYAQYGYAGYDSAACGTEYYHPPTTSQHERHGHEASTSEPQQLSAEELFRQAMQAEQEREFKKGAGKNIKQDIKFVEINAKQLTKMDPAARQAADSIQTALGSEYAGQLRASAKAFVGDKTARRKHQIGTLFHNARMKELDNMEMKSAGMKTKSETQAKYGW